MTLKLFVGDRTRSSWSLRPYLALVTTGAPFEVERIALDTSQTKARIAAVSPSGRVPALHDGELCVWDSLAICEYIAEKFPAAHLWPREAATRAVARSVAAEMHSGFTALRRDMSMHLFEQRHGMGHTVEALADAARVQEIWRTCLRTAVGGPFLFGGFSIADAMFAPVVTRFATYGVLLDAVCTDYALAVEALPAMQQWRADAALE